MGRIIITFILAIALTASAYLLWQRQPKSPITQSSTTEAATEEAEQDDMPKLVRSPQDNSVLTSTKIKFSGELRPDTYLGFYTNDNQYIIKTDPSGKIDAELTFSDGLNLISILSFNFDRSPSVNQNLTIYVSDQPEGNNVFAGTVKSLFGSSFTLTTGTGDKNIKTTKSTKINSPKNEEFEATASVEDIIRVGDFLVAIGNSKDNEAQDAKNLEIIRENKPNNVEILTAIKTTTGVSQNILAATNRDNSPLSLTLDKNTQVRVAEKEGIVKDITKDKNAFVFYHTEGEKNTADLIYLLP